MCFWLFLPLVLVAVLTLFFTGPGFFFIFSLGVCGCVFLSFGVPPALAV